ncbi:hypothetical protein BU23DRAFT_645108 [Bimuria novae-zelandiae CBS 107.79]|uniref:Uncharacterized protein n=1 Tax=Bimuria novae-zelandiae CBS 107.79 TaxID=1447943 RepID=A0A6A5V4F9_9PLEO|nr:hypothetical protein BU23DRAFT_645108 [Bimuria novae-zelandiae CBS 107.79]
MTDSKPLTAFISGPLEPSDEYFATHYIPRLDAAIAAHHTFVIGPVRGVDTLALSYLLSQNVSPDRITIFMASFEYANETWRKEFEAKSVNVYCVEDAVTTRERDAAMTEKSDYDILRYRTEGEAREVYGKGWWPRVSNTEVNERRRRGVGSLEYTLGEEGKEGEGSKGGEDGGESGKGSKREGLRRLFGRK